MLFWSRSLNWSWICHCSEVKPKEQASQQSAAVFLPISLVQGPTKNIQKCFLRALKHWLLLMPFVWLLLGLPNKRPDLFLLLGHHYWNQGKSQSRSPQKGSKDMPFIPPKTPTPRRFARWLGTAFLPLQRLSLADVSGRSGYQNGPTFFRFAFGIAKSQAKSSLRVEWCVGLEEGWGGCVFVLCLLHQWRCYVSPADNVMLTSTWRWCYVSLHMKMIFCQLARKNYVRLTCTRKGYCVDLHTKIILG